VIALPTDREVTLRLVQGVSNLRGTLRIEGDCWVLDNACGTTVLVAVGCEAEIAASLIPADPFDIETRKLQRIGAIVQREQRVLRRVVAEGEVMLLRDGGALGDITVGRTLAAHGLVTIVRATRGFIVVRPTEAARDVVCGKRVA
jgi:hypothetical protein